MGPACGIAGSPRPEAQGVFLCSDEHEASYFVDMNNTVVRVMFGLSRE